MSTWVYVCRQRISYTIFVGTCSPKCYSRDFTFTSKTKERDRLHPSFFLKIVRMKASFGQLSTCRHFTLRRKRWEFKWLTCSGTQGPIMFLDGFVSLRSPEVQKYAYRFWALKIFRDTEAPSKGLSWVPKGPKSVGSWLISWLEMIGFNSQDVPRLKNVQTFTVSPFLR